MLAVVFAVLLQQAAPSPGVQGQVLWTTPITPPPEAPAAPRPILPDAARADPYGYERAECSPYVRASSETLEACQFRIRSVLAASLGEATPDGLRPSAESERCRPDPRTGGFALDCGITRTVPAGPDLADRRCETRPTRLPQGGVAYTENCASTRPGESQSQSLSIKLFGDD
ncbi:hypothetical protein [Brevundimonas sp.]